MRSEIESILVPEEQLSKRIAELGEAITRDYKGQQLLLIGVLKGSVVFMADLMRRIDLDVSIDFMAVSSYGSGTKTSGQVRILKDLNRSIEGQNILIIEDILDSGVTLSYLTGLLWSRKPASIRLCTLLDKPERRRVDVKPDYVGFTIPDAFVVGYGLDYDERFRQLPYVGILKPEVYA